MEINLLKSLPDISSRTREDKTWMTDSKISVNDFIFVGW